MKGATNSERLKNIIKENIAAWLFLIPYLGFFICFLLFPILRYVC